jgi:hypothetical protein
MGTWQKFFSYLNKVIEKKTKLYVLTKYKEACEKAAGPNL